MESVTVTAAQAAQAYKKASEITKNDAETSYNRAMREGLAEPYRYGLFWRKKRQREEHEVFQDDISVVKQIALYHADKLDTKAASYRMIPADKHVDIPVNIATYVEWE